MLQRPPGLSETRNESVEERGKPLQHDLAAQ